MLAVTTAHADGYHRYGRRMIQSFLDFWPADDRLLVYTEDWEPDILDPRVEYRDIMGIADLAAFKGRHTFDERAHGKVSGRYDFRYDAVRFAHKTFAVIDATRDTEEPLVAWIDADTVTHSRVPPKFIEGLVPAGPYTAYLGRAFNYPECGFVAYRPQHPSHAAFMESWRRLYVDGTLFRLDEWHDSWVYDWLRRQFEARGWITSFDLASRTPDTHHPFINSPLGAYMDHFKGDRKVIGRTPPGEMIAGHRARHWSLGA